MIVSKLKKMAHIVGAVLDEEDRHLLAQIVIIVTSVVGTILVAAFTLGLAVRLFEFASG
jgi:hypothetical protein